MANFCTKIVLIPIIPKGDIMNTKKFYVRFRLLKRRSYFRNKIEKCMESFDANKPIFDTNKRDLPNASAVLILGIISIVGCFCSGLPGTICAIIALVLASKDKKLLQENPLAYTENSIKNLESGRICAIIGLSVSALFIIGAIIYLVFIGTFLGSEFWNEFN